MLIRLYNIPKLYYFLIVYGPHLFGSFSLVLHEIRDNIILNFRELTARIMYYFYPNWKNNYSHISVVCLKTVMKIWFTAHDIYFQKGSRRYDAATIASAAVDPKRYILYKRNIRYLDGIVVHLSYFMEEYRSTWNCFGSTVKLVRIY